MSATPPGAPARPKTATLRRNAGRLSAVAGTTALAFSLVTPSSMAATGGPIIVGAMGDVTALSHSVGTPLAVHQYGQLSGSVPSARMVTMEPGSTSWGSIAGAKAGSATYNNIVRWATTIKSRSGLTLFGFDHEPEASGSSNKGGAANYIAAYRHVADIFRAQGVHNVEYTWQMTANAFKVSSGDPRYAAKWYPGSSYVDNVAADPYNWYKCGQGHGQWTELSSLVTPVISFAKARGKHVVLAEWGSDADARRSQWLKNAGQYFIANRSVIRGVFYFQNSHRSGCEWQLKSAADISAFRSFASNKAYFGS
jgi:hypothetical protein